MLLFRRREEQREEKEGVLFGHTTKNIAGGNTF